MPEYEVRENGLFSKAGTKMIAREGMDSIRAQVLAERDRELDRWRWPENPEYVVYPGIVHDHEMAFGPDLSVMVFHEPTGVLKGYCREEDQGGSSREYPNAARAYFDAHPEEKPWHSAKLGEVWAVTWEGRESACEVVAGDHYSDNKKGFMPIGSKREDPGTTAPIITDARRIWPEDSE